MVEPMSEESIERPLHPLTKMVFDMARKIGVDAGMPPRHGEDVAVLALLDKHTDRQRYTQEMKLEWSRHSDRPLPWLLKRKCKHLSAGPVRAAWRDTTARVRTHADFNHVDQRAWNIAEYWAIMTSAGADAAAILQLDAWQSPALDDEGIRIDLAATLHHIGAQMLEAIHVTTTLGDAPTGTTPEETGPAPSSSNSGQRSTASGTQ
jgi:hypothetical protein